MPPKKKLENLIKDSPQSKKMEAIQKAVASLQSKFGKESVNFLGNKKAEPIPRFSTGSISIDKITGGGYPIGRIIQIFGPPSSGKTTLCYHAIAEAQKKFPDKWCGFVDSEQTFDAEYASNVGVDVGCLVTAQPDSGTDALGIIQGMIEAGASLIVIDSVAAMMPKEEAEEEDYGHNTIGAQARMMSKGLRKLNAISGKNKCTLIFTNQTRSKIGVLYGNPETVSGGNSLTFYASVRIRISQNKKIEEMEDGEKVIKAIEFKVSTVKNKVFAPFKTAVGVIVFGEGIDNDAGILDIAISAGLINKKGSWYSINGENVSQGMVELKKYLESNPELYEDIKNKAREYMLNDKKEAEQLDEKIDADSMTDDEIAEKSMQESDNDDAEVGEV